MSHLREPRLDGNLLLALEVLLREGSVTRAALELGIGQPGTSHLLQRLREHFGDPLLVRSGRRMVLTPLGAALREPAQEAVAAMRRVLARPVEFQPAALRRTFRVATSDHVGMTLLPSVIEQLAQQAPGVDLDIRPVTEATHGSELEDARVDLALGPFTPSSAAIQSEPLFQEGLVCLVRQGHPRGKGRLTLKALAELSHVLVSPRGTRTGALDQLLAEQGLKRRVVLTVPHFLLAPFILARTDHVLLLPESLAERFVDLAALQRVELAFPLPRFTISQLWHTRNDSRPEHVWLRQLFHQAVRSLRG